MAKGNHYWAKLFPNSIVELDKKLKKIENIITEHKNEK